MRAETRHQLKQDRFSRATFGAAEATVHWTVEHQAKLMIGSLVLLVALGAGVGGWYYLNQQDQKASAQFNQAVRTLDTSLRPAAAPATAMGSVLAGMSCVGSAAAERVLVGAAACLPTRDTLAQRVEDAGGLSTRRSGQRVAVAPAMV